MDAETRWLHPGFSRDSVLSYLFKHTLSRTDTSLAQAYYQEGFSRNSVPLNSLATDSIPHEVPTDFATLTVSEISEIFQVTKAEVNEFNTTIDGVSAFSVEKSASNPHILKINNLLMKPYIKNIDGTFTGFTSTTQINLVANAIDPAYGNGGYKRTVMRSGISGELSLRGRNLVNVQHLAHIFDNENGIFMLHEPDLSRNNPIHRFAPPIISCYVYRGNFGRLGWLIRNNATILNETQLLLGKPDITDPDLIMDVSGSAFIDDLFVNSVTTHSDIRLKENIAPAITNYDILDLNPVYYNYKSKPDVKEYGLIAQEVQKVAPDIVRQNGDYLAVQYDRIGVHLLPIIKEQQSRIESLERQVGALVKLLEGGVRA